MATITFKVGTHKSEPVTVTAKDLQIVLAPIRTDLTVLKWMIGFLLAGVASLILKLLF